MSIQKKPQDSKGGNKIFTEKDSTNDSVHTAILCVLLFIFIAFSSFALGKLSVKKEGAKSFIIETVAPELITNPPNESSTGKTAEAGSLKEDPQKEGGEAAFVVGSKNSNKYHFVWCSGAKRIKPENIVSFPSFEAARAAGYSPASNCEGLE